MTSEGLTRHEAVLLQQNFTITNSDFSSKLSKSLQKFQKVHCLCDVEVATCEDSGSAKKKIGHSLYAHSCVLASASPFFYKLLTEEKLKDQNKKLILLNKINFRFVKLCIDFAYGHSIEISKEELPDLAKAADMFKIEPLPHYCRILKCKLANIEKNLPGNGLFDAYVGDPSSLSLQPSAKSVIQPQTVHDSKMKQNTLTPEALLQNEDPIIPDGLENSPVHEFKAQEHVIGKTNKATHIFDPIFSGPKRLNLADLAQQREKSTKKRRKTQSYDHTYSVSHLIHCGVKNESEEVGSETMHGDKERVNIQAHPLSLTQSARPLKKLHKHPSNLGPFRKSYASAKERRAFRKLRDEKPTVCRHCGETFKNYRTMRTHLEKTYRTGTPCQYCGKAFISPAALRLHEQRHVGIKNFKCDECDFVAVTRAEVGLHKFKHQTEKKVMCDVCGACFKNKKTLNLHMKKLHDETAEKLQCPHCDFETTIRTILKNHLPRHDIHLRSKCDYCDKTYNKPASLKQHLLKNHGVVLRVSKGYSLERAIEDTISKATELDQEYNTTSNGQLALPSDIFACEEVEVEGDNTFPHVQTEGEIPLHDLTYSIGENITLKSETNVQEVGEFFFT